jgi:PKHD-type hydroxylase
MINLQTNARELNVPCVLNPKIGKSVLPVSYALINNFLTNEECDNFVKYVEECCPLAPGLNRLNELTTSRYSDIAFVERTGDNDWLFDKIINKIIPLNRQYQQFHLTHIDRLQYATYTKNQYLDYHTDDYFDFIQTKDKGRDLLLRKLSISIGLNEEYEGGEFEIQNFKGTPNEPYDIKKFRLPKGSAIIFPSFQLHKIHRVTEGTRKAVVAWFFGPKWK